MSRPSAGWPVHASAPNRRGCGALTILERFLKEPVDESLVIGLRDPNAVALQSLNELIQEMERAPVAIIEYLNQLAEQPPEVPQMVLDAVPLLPLNPHLVTLLRMFAQGQAPRLAQTAVEQLGRIRQPEAIAALTSLAATLPPSLAPLADRSAREAADERCGVSSHRRGGWRALMSPIDGAGAQVIWFISHADGQPHGSLLGVLTQDPKGIIVGFGSPEVPAENLPPVQPVGTIIPIVQADDASPIIMLETPFEVARAVLRRAHEQNWASGTPMPIEYRLLNAWIWEIPLPRPGAPGSKGAGGQGGRGNGGERRSIPAHWRLCGNRRVARSPRLCHLVLANSGGAGSGEEVGGATHPGRGARPKSRRWLRPNSGRMCGRVTAGVWRAWPSG